jgi:hypothetical protein
MNTDIISYLNMPQYNFRSPQPAKKGEPQELCRSNARLDSYGDWYNWLICDNCEYNDETDPYIRDEDGDAYFHPIWANNVNDAIKQSVKVALELYESNKFKLSETVVKKLKKMEESIHIEDLRDEYETLFIEFMQGDLSEERFEYIIDHMLSLRSEITTLCNSIE